MFICKKDGLDCATCVVCVCVLSKCVGNALQMLKAGLGWEADHVVES